MTKKTLLRRVTTGLAEVAAGLILHWTADSLAEDLDDLWHPKPPAKDSGVRYCSKAPMMDYEFGGRKPAPPPKRPPPWYIGMSSAFSKDISKIDRKLQGRILEAITEITQEPMILRGDTVKPLTGELQGCWRYRLGDYRLIYSPDKATGDITLVAFASRGSVYVD